MDNMETQENRMENSFIFIKVMLQRELSVES